MMRAGVHSDAGPVLNSVNAIAVIEKKMLRVFTLWFAVAVKSLARSRRVARYGMRRSMVELAEADMYCGRNGLYGHLRRRASASGDARIHVPCAE